ncbi:disulfide bond formation protein B [Meridianimarinicoccus roseus]|uniref:Disulfide bond formation protein B n=1 Tax=Meridianimarinicoccus roseus TaxID=2072018 RepID=A0A2V2LKJ5_9RHOB|nr:disulfide bond formation protein B [Meridianimarinicoccus roseus]PWR02323.1 disulfide bond formation protein B [Meridianimarinicoccus roseus]
MRLPSEHAQGAAAQSLAFIAGAGSAAMLLGAWSFQYLGGLPPCPICIWQRWPHAFAVILALLIGSLPLRLHRAVIALGALAATTTAAFGIYHTGIERGWWPGPDSCTGRGSGLGGLSGADLLSTDAPVNLVMCDEVVWSMLGLSMASWNAVISLFLAGLWLAALRARA